MLASSMPADAPWSCARRCCLCQAPANKCNSCPESQVRPHSVAPIPFDQYAGGAWATRSARPSACLAPVQSAGDAACPGTQHVSCNPSARATCEGRYHEPWNRVRNYFLPCTLPYQREITSGARARAGLRQEPGQGHRRRLLHGPPEVERHAHRRVVLAVGARVGEPQRWRGGPAARQQVCLRLHQQVEPGGPARALIFGRLSVFRFTSTAAACVSLVMRNKAPRHWAPGRLVSARRWRDGARVPRVTPNK